MNKLWELLKNRNVRASFINDGFDGGWYVEIVELGMPRTMFRSASRNTPEEAAEAAVDLYLAAYGEVKP